MVDGALAELVVSVTRTRRGFEARLPNIAAMLTGVESHLNEARWTPGVDDRIIDLLDYWRQRYEGQVHWHADAGYADALRDLRHHVDRHSRWIKQCGEVPPVGVERYLDALSSLCLILTRWLEQGEEESDAGFDSGPCFSGSMLEGHRDIGEEEDGDADGYAGRSSAAQD